MFAPIRPPLMYQRSSPTGTLPSAFSVRVFSCTELIVFAIEGVRAPRCDWFLAAKEGGGVPGLLRCRPARPPKTHPSKQKRDNARILRRNARPLTGRPCILIGRLPLFRCFFFAPSSGVRLAIGPCSLGLPAGFPHRPPHRGVAVSAPSIARDSRCEYRTPLTPPVVGRGPRSPSRIRVLAVLETSNSIRL